MAGHAQLKFVMTESSKTQIRLTGLMYKSIFSQKRTDIYDSTPTAIYIQYKLSSVVVVTAIACGVAKVRKGTEKSSVVR